MQSRVSRLTPFLRFPLLGMLLLPLLAAGEHLTRVPAGEHLWAQRLLYSGDMAGAIAAWQKGLQADPDNAPMLGALGAALYLAERPADAVAYLRRASQRAPHDWTLALFLGAVLQESGDDAAARRQLERVVDRAPNAGTVSLARDRLHGRYHGYLARARSENGIGGPPARFWSAQLVEVRLGREERDGSLHDDGSLLPLLRMVSLAGQAFREAPAAGFAAPDCIEVYYRLPIRVFPYASGRYLVAAGSASAEEARARHEVLQLLELGLEHARLALHDSAAEEKFALKLRSFQQLRAGEGRAALASLREVVGLFPEDFQARRLFASLLASHGEHGAAATELAVLARRRPAHPGVHLLAGTLELQRGRAGEARERLKKAIALNPTLLDAYRALAKAALVLERPAEAIEALEHVLEAAPHAFDVPESLARLRGG